MKDSFDKLTLEELESKKRELEKENFNLRVNRVYGHLDNPLALRNTRRKIARINTRISEIKLGIHQDK
ncbi:MAG TPA: 50S ribosomal protein L29 [Spirochaetaceae bacterium]|nr:50S ribosomal protein L29 [Spirochaetaceae bacterium]